MLKNLFDSFPKITTNVYEDMMAETGLDLQVSKHTLAYCDGLGNQVNNPDKVAIARVDNGAYLGTVGTDYGVTQYDEVYKFAEILANDNGAEYVSGGLVGKGERAFLALKTGDHVVLCPGDVIESYFYVATGHDGQQAIDVIPAPLRTVNNSVLMMPETRGFRFRHTKHITSHLANARLSIEKVKTYWDRFKTSFNYLAATGLTRTQLDDYLKMVVEGKDKDSSRAEGIREEIRTIFLKDKYITGLPSTNGTLLGAYFAVVQYCDFNSVTRKSKNDRRDPETCRIMSLIDGNAAKRKADGYGFAIQMLNKLNGVSVSV
jgi:phage/plasmid-like protein (TIGR03299 family)